MEVEAEFVAYIVAGLAGCDTSAYSIGCSAGWTNSDIGLIRDAAGRMLKTAHAIADCIAV